jgi:hypothetical protein
MPRNNAAFSRCVPVATNATLHSRFLLALCPHTHLFPVASIEDWALSGDRSSAHGPGDDGPDDAQPKAPVQAPVQLQQLSQSRSSQILTIEDEQPTVAAPVLNPPRTASFLQRLLAACACGTRQGKMDISLHTVHAHARTWQIFFHWKF